MISSFIKVRLDLAPTEIQKFVAFRCFKFCSVAETLDFLVKWLNHNIASITDDHLTVLCNVLINLQSKDSDIVREEMKQYSDKIIKLTGRLSDLVKHSDTKKRKLCLEKLEAFASVLESFRGERYNLRSSKTPKAQKQVNREKPEYENMILTFSPKQCVIKYEDNWDNDIIERFPNFYDCPVFDICAYIPRTKSWIYLDEVDDKEVYYWMIRMDGLGGWDYLCKGRSLYCLYSESDDLSFLVKLDDFNDCRSIKGPYRSMYPPSGEFPHSSERYIVKSSNKDLHLIQKLFDMKMKDGKLVYETCFHCCRYTSSTRSWSKVCTTPVIDLTNDFGDIIAAISSSSNEMLMILFFRARIICSFVASFDEGDPIIHKVHPTEDMSPAEIDKDMEREGSTGDRYSRIEIVDGNNQFFVIGLNYVEGSPLRNARCLYEYRFRSGVLAQVDKPALSFKDYSNIYSTSGHPCFSFRTVSDLRSVWVLTGNKKGASNLTEIMVDEAGNLSTREHTPPPFCCVTAAVPVRVESSYFWSRKSVDRYLLAE